MATFASLRYASQVVLCPRHRTREAILHIKEGATSITKGKEAKKETQLCKHLRNKTPPPRLNLLRFLRSGSLGVDAIVPALHKQIEVVALHLLALFAANNKRETVSIGDETDRAARRREAWLTLPPLKPRCTAAGSAPMPAIHTVIITSGGIASSHDIAGGKGSRRNRARRAWSASGDTLPMFTCVPLLSDEYAQSVEKASPRGRLSA